MSITHLQAQLPHQNDRRLRRSEERELQQNLRRRRRDLLEDVGLAFAILFVVLIVAPGLGVVALLDVLVAIVLIGAAVAERRIRRRRRL